MKYFLSLFFLGTSFSVYATCNGKIDPSKVMVFVDVNESDLEIQTAEKAACSRGERIVIVPKNYKEYQKYTNEARKYREQTDKCLTDLVQTKPVPDHCEDIINKLGEANAKLSNFQSSQPNITESLKQALKEVREKKGKIDSLIISGHDGGGHFGGSKGGFGRNELSKIMADLEGINDIKSLMLLGCYTGVQKEVEEWKKIFPNIRLIGGYDDSAPLSTRPQGHKYLSDLLLKEKSLYKMSDEKKLQNFAEANLASMFALNSAVYLQCLESPNKNEFYYGSKTSQKKFSPIDMKVCEDKEKIRNLYQTVDKYASGELEIPKNTATGELRQLYNTARTMEHCFGADLYSVNVQTVFNLLFYEGVKKNFANFYKKDLEAAEKILSQFSPEQVDKKTKNQLDQLDKKIKALEEKIKLIDADPKAYKASLDKDLDTIKEKMNQMISAPMNQTIRQYMLGQLNRTLTPEEKKYFEEYTEISTRYFSLTQDKRALDIDPLHAKSAAESQIKQLVQLSNTIQDALISFKSNPQVMNDIWVPTEKNLESKGRKETLENIHKMTGLLATNILPDEQTKALSFVIQASSKHLQYFDNPFSWHEYTGRTPEAPRNPASMNSSNLNYYGGGLGGMYSGGLGSGYGGGGFGR